MNHPFAAQVYAALCVVAYPVGVPLAFLVLLLGVRDAISTSDYDAYVARILSGRDDVLAMGTDQVRTTPHAGGAAAAEEDKFRELYSRDKLRRVRSSIFRHKYEAGVAVHAAAAEYVRVRDALDHLRADASPDNTREAADQCLITLGEKIVTGHRDIDPVCAHLTFLFSEYEPRCWCFEGAPPAPPAARRPTTEARRRSPPSPRAQVRSASGASL